MEQNGLAIQIRDGPDPFLVFATEVNACNMNYIWNLEASDTSTNGIDDVEELECYELFFHLYKFRFNLSAAGISIFDIKQIVEAIP